MIAEIISIIKTKGFLIGFFSALMKVMQDVRGATFKWVIALTDLIAGTSVGYSVYQWSSESEQLANWQIYGLTIMFSLNAFLVVKIVTEPKIVQQLIKSWFKIDVSDDK